MKLSQKIGSIVLDVVIVLLIIVIIFNIVFISKKNRNELPSVFGYKFLVDLTESMEPSIGPGDLVIIKELDKYKIGDVVTYRDKSDSLITHRIIEIKDNRYYFKGDKNNAKDSDGVTLNKIEGKYVNKIRKLGTICLFLKSIYGIIMLLSIGIFYLVFLIIKEKYYY